MSIYLDYQASKPVDPRVIEAMTPHFYDHYGNPSSLHEEGDKALQVLGNARKSLARFINSKPEEIIFTSGATEANNLALLGYAQRNKLKGDHIIISEIEHISVLNLAKKLEKMGFSVSKIPVNQYGEVTVEKLEEHLIDKTILVSIQYANNEIGTVQSIKEMGKLCRNRRIIFHTDAVAAEGLIPLDVQRDYIDLMTLSSNDIYGPKGVGALFVRGGIKLMPGIIGGGQERGLRSGSENIPGIAGMAAAAEVMIQEIDTDVKNMQAHRDKLIRSILEAIPQSYLNGHQQKRLANNVNVRFDGIEGESMLLSLRHNGFAVATGSACSSKTLEPSHTLMAIGLRHEEAHGSLELTVGRFTKSSDIDALLEALPEVQWLCRFGGLNK